MDVKKPIKKTITEPIKKLTTSNLNQNILVQGALFSAGALGAEYMDSYIREGISRIPIKLPIDPTIITQLSKMGISLVAMVFIKQPLVQTALFGVFAQSMLVIVRQLLGKFVPTTLTTPKAEKLSLVAPKSTYGQWG